jgi:hypothetical protein
MTSKPSSPNANERRAPDRAGERTVKVATTMQPWKPIEVTEAERDYLERHGLISKPSEEGTAR